MPAGGFFVWVTLPPGLDSHAMLPRAVTARVAYVPGTAFYADGFGSRHMRLSYCYPTPQRIIEGTRRLGEVLAYEAGVLETFGPGVRRRTRGRHCRPVRGSRSPNRVNEPQLLPRPSSCWPVGFPTSAMSRCAPVGGSARRCGHAVLEVVESDVDSALLPRLADAPRRGGLSPPARRGG